MADNKDDLSNKLKNTSKELEKNTKSVKNLNSAINGLNSSIRSINKLNNAIDSLNSNVGKLQQSLNSLSRPSKTSDTPIAYSQESIGKVIAQKMKDEFKQGNFGNTGNYKVYKKEGLTQNFEKKLDKLGEQINKETEDLNILLNSINKENPSLNLEIEETKEFNNKLREIVGTLESIGVPAEQLERVLSNIITTSEQNQVAADEFAKLMRNATGEITGVLHLAGPLAQNKAEVSRLNESLQNLKKEVDNTQDTIKRTNDVVLDLATNSDTVNKLMLDMNVNLEMANDNLRIFNMLLGSAGNAQWQQETQIKNNVQAMGQMQSVMVQMQQSMTRLTNANARALQRLQNAGTSPSSNSGGSSFREQATRNSDRAKQAGFIALLIPALAKLLKKTPLTDLFRLFALRLGSGLSGRGEHPVLGALGLMGAPLLSGALFSSVFRKQLLSVGGKLFGVPQIPKTVKQISRSTNLLTPRTLKNWEQLVQGFRQGWNLPEVASKMNGGYNSLNRARLLRNVANVTDVKRTSLSGGKTAIASLSGKTGYVTHYNAALMGENLRRLFTKPNAGMLGAKGLTQSAAGAGLTKGLLKRVPILGTVLSAAFEVPELMKAKKSGDNELWGNQVAKSVGGVTGGVIGATAGGILGAATGPLAPIVVPIAAAIGGMLGDAIGRFVGPPIRKGFQNAMSGLKGTFESIKEHTKGAREGFSKLSKSLGRIGSAFGNLLSPITSRLSKWANKVEQWVGKLISIGAEKTIELIVNGIDSFITKVDKTVNTIADLIDAIANGFHDLGQRLLSTPILGPLLQKIYGETPETNTVTNNTNEANKKESERLKKELEKYEDPNSKEYKAKRQEFYDQYIRANIGNYQKEGLLGIKYVPEEENKKLETEANTWADKMMNEEKYKLKVQKAALENGVGTSALPSNLTTVKKNGIEAVAMKDLGLNGAIGRGNSVPYIAAANAQNLKNLDNYLSSKGYKFTYTSAMGGSHAGGAKSHGAGQKVDLVLNQGGRLKAEDEQWLMANGFYGGVTGAVGYHNAGSGYHYDLSVSGGKGLTAAQAAAQQQSTATQAATQTATSTTEETASSEIRKDLAAIVGAKGKSDKQERARNIIFSAVDVTGSLGVWGITQLNNGVMRTGR